MRVAFQGEHGAYSEEAALALLGQEIDPVPCATFDEVFAAVQQGQCAQGVVPVENSLAGAIHRNYDLLLRHSLFIVAEHNLRISHCLIAHPGVTTGEIRRVYSHPQALAQCENSLHALGEVETVATHDTAGSVRMVKDMAARDAAAIASERAAALYEMSVLRHGFEDEKTNYTRFIALATEAWTPADVPCKTSLAFAGRNEPGLLFRCLSAFALRDIDLTKIESRPLRGVPWEYIFYLDFVGSLAETRCQRALAQLQEMATFVRVFGTYPRAQNAWTEQEHV